MGPTIETDADRHGLTVYFGAIGRPMVPLEEAVEKLDALAKKAALMALDIECMELEIASFEMSVGALREAKEWLDCLFANRKGGGDE